MKHNKLRTTQKQIFNMSLQTKLTLVGMITGALALVLFMISSPVLVTVSTESSANNPNYYSSSPRLDFRNPTLISGTAGAVGAVYCFSNVATSGGNNVDAWVRIQSITKNATLSDIDNDGSGFSKAWQPFVTSPGKDTSYIDWQIVFKKSGTNTDTVLSLVSVTAIDVDGNGSDLRELVAASPASSMAKHSTSNLTFSYNGVTQTAISGYPQITNIDSNQRQAMFQMNFNNVNTI